MVSEERLTNLFCQHDLPLVRQTWSITLGPLYVGDRNSACQAQARSSGSTCCRGAHLKPGHMILLTGSAGSSDSGGAKPAVCGAESGSKSRLCHGAGGGGDAPAQRERGAARRAGGGASSSSKVAVCRAVCRASSGRSKVALQFAVQVCRAVAASWKRLHNPLTRLVVEHQPEGRVQTLVWGSRWQGRGIPRPSVYEDPCSSTTG